MRKVIVAATQMSCSWNIDENIKKAEKLVRAAASKGAQIILLQELFETPYFCQTKDTDYFKYATEVEVNKAITHFKSVAEELKVVIPISFYEKKANTRYNSVAIIDADGKVLGTYRKTHIPDGPGYEEKFYFNAGDTGFKVWDTKYAKIGVGICWDQWFPECARSMALMGAEILFYPTAIGSEPNEPEVNSKLHWQMCMQGHAAANIIPVVASNRIGYEKSCAKDAWRAVQRSGTTSDGVTFYGSSFITNHKGEKIEEADCCSESVIISCFDLDEIARYRDYWSVYRDRRPEMYKAITEGNDCRDK